MVKAWLPTLCLLVSTAPASWPSWSLMAAASSHWVVTEHGKIQSQGDSVFHMKRPYDLVAFLQQEERVDRLDRLREEMTRHNDLERINIEDQFDPNFETRFFERDDDCRLSGHPLTEFDLYNASPSGDIMGMVRDFLAARDVPDNQMTPPTRPFCSKPTSTGGTDKRTKEVDVTLGRLDKLSGMTRKEELKTNDAIALTAVMLQPRKLQLFQYGQIVADSLEKDPDQWLPNLLASYYWRILGVASEAIDCLRSSIFHAPTKEKHYGYLALSNVLHRAHRFDDAVEVLKEALNVSPGVAPLYFALANVYATSMQFDQAQENYLRCLEKDPSFDEARQRLHAVRCHVKLEDRLEEKHKMLEKTLLELRTYKRQHENWSSLLNRIVNEQASIETRLEVRMGYEHFKIRSSANGRGQDCVQYESFGQTYLYCSLQADDGEYSRLLEEEQAVHGNHQDQLEELLRTFERELGTTKHIDKSSNVSNESVDEDEDPGTPSKPALFQTWPKALATDVSYLTPNWPSEDDCSPHFAKPRMWNEYPTVFLSPENKGFDIKRMLSTDIEYPIDFSAPLPWFPPVCKRYEGKTESRYDRMKTIDEWTFISVKIPEVEIESDFDAYSPVKNYREWGARVTQAMNINLAPKWIFFLLAGTYWRIFGHPQNGIHCLRHALEHVPTEYKDVVLTNFAGLLYKTGAVDDALVMMKDAVAINDREPETNFFLANLYSAKGNISGAIFHYRQALRMKPDYTAAHEFLHIPACHAKFYQKRETGAEASSEGMCTDDFDRRTSPFTDSGTELLIFCRDSHCKFVTAEEHIQLTGSKKEAGGAADINDAGAKPEQDAFGEKIKLIPEPGPESATAAMKTEGGYQSRIETGSPVSGPVLVTDDPLPDVLLRVREKLSTPMPTSLECDRHKEINWDSFTSTWLSLSAKGIDIKRFIPDDYPQDPRPPLCPNDVPVSLLTLDHLEGVKKRGHLQFSAESGLQEPFRGLTGEESVSLEEMAARLTLAMEKNSSSWVLSTAAALYWRVRGNSEQAVECLRHSLYNAPTHMKDIPLISLANIFHRAGLLNDALIVTNMALEISPKFVVTHFTMANIYVSKGDFDMAASFYLSTLALQSTFDPARERLLSLRCRNRG